MAYVVTDACKLDFVCVEQCATNAIAPAQDDAAAAGATQVYINPDDCIDCGNCASVCEHTAIFAESDLPADKAEFAGKNRGYFN